MHEEWTDRLSDHLDGELPADERDAVEAHLRGCAECAAVLDDLQRVVARAAAVDARPPQSDLWAAIAGRIEAAAEAARVVPFAPREARRFAFTLPQLAAAAALLISVSGGMAWEVARRSGRPDGLRDGSAASAADTSAPVAQPFRAANRDLPRESARHRHQQRGGGRELRQREGQAPGIAPPGARRDRHHSIWRGSGAARRKAICDAGPQVRVWRARVHRRSARHDALQVVEYRRARRAVPEMRLDGAPLVRRQLAIEIVRQLVRPFLVHGYSPERCFRINMRALCSCRFDVPVAISSITAISRCL